MTLTLKNVSIAAILTVSLFVAWGFLNDAQAYDWSGSGSSCGSCEGPGGGEPPTGEYGDPPPPPKAPAKCVSLTANKTTLPNGGGNVVLTWKTQNATSASITGVGAVSVNGSKTVKVTKATTFTLTVKGVGGNGSCKVSVKVQPAEVAKCVSFTANRSTVPEGGGDVTLTWKTQNAKSVSISGIGAVAANGSKTVNVTSNTTFTLTVKGAANNANCVVKITVKPDEEEKTSKCVSFDANKTRVDEDGENVTLTWETENATSVRISDIGNVNRNGSTNVFVDEDTTFTLTVEGADNDDSCKVTIRTDEEEEDEKTPRCELDISKDRVKRGEKVTLSWETTHVDDIRIRDDHGNTIFDTDDYRSSERKRYFDGEIDVIINQATEFTMTAGGVDGGSKTCRVDVEVDDIAVYEKRDQGYVIALTQVPYTGFEAGTFLTFLFYAVLTLWALFVAYILVIQKGTVFGFSLYGNTAGVSATDMENRKKVEALVAKYAGSSWK
jgi:hypothetical protein